MQKVGEITIVATGVQLTAGAATSRVAIPTQAAGGVAKIVRIMAAGTCYIRPGDSTINAVATDIFLTANEAIILNVSGCTHIAGLRVGGADVLVNISPVEVS